MLLVYNRMRVSMKGTTMVAKSYLTIIANVVHGAWSAFAKTNPFERSSSTEEILSMTDIIAYTYQKICPTSTLSINRT